MGAFATQTADALSQTGQRIAGAVKDAGDVAVKFEDHREISAGAAAFSKLQADLTDQWNQTAKNSDPNDPSVAAKFRETVLEPALEKFQGGFNTENKPALCRAEDRLSTATICSKRRRRTCRRWAAESRFARTTRDKIAINSLASAVEARTRRRSTFAEIDRVEHKIGAIGRQLQPEH